MQYIICDIGGTTTRIAQASEESLTMDPIFFPTEQDFTKELHLLKEHITSMHMNEPIHSMVVGLPGALSKDKSTLYKAPHLPDWNGRPLRDELSQAFQTPVFLESDAALVGVDGEKPRGDTLPERRAPAPGVVALGPLDLDHLGAQMGENLGRHGPGQILRDLDDGDALERKHGATGNW